MHQIRTTITRDGEIVIPVSIRKEMNLHIGEEVFFEIKLGGLYISTFKQVVKKSQTLVKLYNKHCVSLSKALLKSRRKVSKRD